jgi:hypothetical protein
MFIGVLLVHMLRSCVLTYKYFVHVYQSKYMFLDPVYQSITYV